MITIFIKVKPGSRQDVIEAGPDGKLIVRIRARPVRGAANKHLVDYLAAFFHLRKSDVVLESGLSGPYKKLSLNISREAFDLAIARLTGPVRRDP